MAAAQSSRPREALQNLGRDRLSDHRNCVQAPARPPPALSGRHALQMHLLLTTALSIQPAVQWVLIENTLSSSAVPDLLLRRRGFCLFPWLALIVRWVVSTDVDICAACKIVNGIPKCHHPGWDTERFGALEDLVCSSSIAAPAPRLPLR